MSMLTKQVGTFEDIKTLCNNYRKDSVSRKTVDYLEKRLETLQQLWNVFHEQHKILLDTLEDKNIGYFNNDVYEKTKNMFESTKQHIEQLLMVQQRQQKQEFGFDLTGVLDEQTDDDLKKLINQQERNFKALTRAMSKINVEFMSEKWEFEEQLAILKSKWESIDKIHWELEDELKASSMREDYISQYEAIEQRYDGLKRELNSKIWSSIHYQQSAPKINIPEFSGSYVQWITFRDIFIETIHNNPSISKAQKMQHLKTKLRGEAERLVHHLAISADNYDSCWEILSHRYDNRRLQFTSFMSAMQHLPTIQHPNASNLKRMHAVITESLNGLANMKIDVSSWGPMVVYFMSQKLDPATLNEYAKETQNNRELPNLEEFLNFLETKFIAYETARSCSKESSGTQPFNKSMPKPHNWPTYKGSSANNNNSNRQQVIKKYTLTEGNKVHPKAFHTAQYGNCPLCAKEHVLRQCEQFLHMDVAQRNKTVAKLKVCKNCLYSHGDAVCTSEKTCRECNLKHHTLLHTQRPHFPETKTKRDESKSISSPSSSSGAHHLANNDTEILLTTVQVKVRSHDSTYITLRGLLDQGSQINLITENAAQLLRLPRTNYDATVTGIGATSRNCKGMLQLNCQSIHSEYEFDIQALVLPNLTNKLPSCTFQSAGWTHLHNLKLADPNYNVSSTIDLLLGADVYANIILDGVLKGPQNSPIAQQTHLGWILCGKLKTYNCHATFINKNDLLKYWESEDITQGAEDSQKDDLCEQYYKETTKRCPDGKYIVKMPMIQSFKNQLGNSKSVAIAQFLQQEKKLSRNEKLATMYRKFIKEYIDLQHMKPA